MLGAHPWEARPARPRPCPADEGRKPRGQCSPRGESAEGAHTAGPRRGHGSSLTPRVGPSAPGGPVTPRRLHTGPVSSPHKESGFPASPPARTLLLPAVCPLGWGWGNHRGHVSGRNTGRDGAGGGAPRTSPFWPLSEPPGQPLGARDVVPPLPSSGQRQGRFPRAGPPQPLPAAPPQPRPHFTFLSRTNFLPQPSGHPHQHLEPRGHPHPDLAPPTPPGSQPRPGHTGACARSPACPH